MVEKVLSPGGQGAKIGCVCRIDLFRCDWNWPKFIAPWFFAADIENAAAPWRQRIAKLGARPKAFGRDR